jgi:hypothetical protein
MSQNAPSIARSKFTVRRTTPAAPKFVISQIVLHRYKPMTGATGPGTKLRKGVGARACTEMG